MPLKDSYKRDEWYMHRVSSCVTRGRLCVSWTRAAFILLKRIFFTGHAILQGFRRRISDSLPLLSMQDFWITNQRNIELFFHLCPTVATRFSQQQPTYASDMHQQQVLPRLLQIVYEVADSWLCSRSVWEINTNLSWPPILLPFFTHILCFPLFSFP
jgi:hypothetical protein